MRTGASVHYRHYQICLALMACLGWLCPSAGIGEITLTDVTKQTGIDFVHTDGSHGGYFVMETVCAGLALFDYDGDGWIDIYFLNGAPLKGAKDTTKPRNRLYRNQGDWTFTDVTSQAGVGDGRLGLLHARSLRAGCDPERDRRSRDGSRGRGRDPSRVIHPVWRRRVLEMGD